MKWFVWSKRIIIIVNFVVNNFFTTFENHEILSAEISIQAIEIFYTIMDSRPYGAKGTRILQILENIETYDFSS